MFRQAFHLVGPSPWPFLGAQAGFGVTCGLVSMFHGGNSRLFILSVCLVGMVMFCWWRDVCREATFVGAHTKVVVGGLRWGMFLFILSEAMFFFSFFWAFFHSSLAPTVELGCCWPPKGINPVPAFGVPLLNTVVLLSSGVSVTWAHKALMSGNLPKALCALFCTVMLGVYFTVLQAGEYRGASFAISDGIYGSTFYVSTGFHGLHVCVGVVMLAVALCRAYWHQFSSGHHFGFDAAAWYWHFVDVVWVFLYVWVYIWGSS